MNLQACKAQSSLARIFLAGLCLCAFVFAGCSSRKADSDLAISPVIRPEEPGEQKPENKPAEGATISGLQQYQMTIASAVQVLRDYGFSIDRQDYRFGMVTTRPLVSPTVFEPWKPTNTSGLQIAEATMNTQRRIVRVELKPIDATPMYGTAPFQYQLTVRVEMIKLQQPLRYLNGSTSGFAIVSSYSAVPAEWKERGITRAYWLADGTDELLAQRIADDISERVKPK